MRIQLHPREGKHLTSSSAPEMTPRLLFLHSKFCAESIWGNKAQFPRICTQGSETKCCLAAVVLVQKTATFSYRKQLQIFVLKLGGERRNKSHLIKVPSCFLMMLTEFSAGKVQHRPRAEHTAMRFRFSSDEPLRRNTPFWKERTTS